MDVDEEHALYMYKRIIETRNSNEQITLVSGGDRKRFPISRVILCTASDFFHAMLMSDFEESNRSEFDMDTVDGETVQAIVDFCYTGRIELSEETVDDIIAVSSFYQIQRLQKKCCAFLRNTLCASTAWKTYLIADEFSLADIRQEAFDLICANLDAIPTSDIQRIDYKVFKRILKCEEVRASEETIFDRLMEWYEHNKIERKECMAELLKCIRLQHITDIFLIDKAEAVYRKFNCLESVIKEYQERALNHSVIVGGHRYDRSQLLRAVYYDFESEDECIHVERFIPALKTFEPIAELMLENRIEYEVVLFEDKLIVVGGSRKTRRPYEVLKSVTSFDMVSGERTNLPEMIYARRHHKVVVCGQYIYAIGGCDGKNLTLNLLNECERLDTKTKKWEPIKSMKMGRSNFAATVMDECIYVVGCFSNSSKSVEKYDPKRDDWISLAEVNRFRMHFTLVSSNGFLYAMGSDKTVERYNPVENEWQMIGSFGERYRIWSAVSVEDNLFVILARGKFGKFTPSESGTSLFEPLGLLNHKWEGKRQLKLFEFHS